MSPGWRQRDNAEIDSIHAHLSARLNDNEVLAKVTLRVVGDFRSSPLCVWRLVATVLGFAPLHPRPVLGVFDGVHAWRR